jgi:hypothetical protein
MFMTRITNPKVKAGLAEPTRVSLPHAPRFEYMTCKVNDLRTITTKRGERTEIDRVIIDGRECLPTPRFMVSLGAKFGFGPQIYRWFEPEEVFERISKRATSDLIRVCVEVNSGASEGASNGASEGASTRPTDKLLGVSNPGSVLIQHDELLGLLSDYGVRVDDADYGHRKFPRSGGSIDPHGIRVGQIGGDQHDNQGGLMAPPEIPVLTYNEGIVRSVHVPRNAANYDIAGDTFGNRFILDVPIDAYGRPAAYLMLLRKICSNGSIGYSRSFRADLSLGKGEDSFQYSLVRAMEGYNNEEGFAALRARYESAANSWASIAEANKVYKALVRLHHKGEARVNHKYLGEHGNGGYGSESGAGAKGGDGASLTDGSPIITSYHKLVGDLSRTYGLANLDALGVKRQRTLPAGCKMYDMLNFLSEVATHHCTPAGARTMQALNGDFLSAEYDLEGTADKFGDWKDFLIQDKAAAESFAMARGGRDKQ